jgi:hypothetical protein
MIRKSFAFIFVFCVLGLVFGCKSIGYHVDGTSRIIRHDTITTKVISEKPVTTNKFVDLK